MKHLSNLLALGLLVVAGQAVAAEPATYTAKGTLELADGTCSYTVVVDSRTLNVNEVDGCNQVVFGNSAFWGQHYGNATTANDGLSSLNVTKALFVRVNLGSDSTVRNGTILIHDTNETLRTSYQAKDYR